MTNIKLIDLDDTLISTEEIYNKIQQQWANFTLEHLNLKSLTAQNIISIQEENDIKKITSHGLTRERFPASLADTYRELSRKAGESDRLREKHAKEAYIIGMGVFDYKNWPQNLLPGAKSTLEFLTEQGDELFVVTLGDKKVQRNKLDFYNLHRWFDDNHICIVPVSKKDTIEKVSRFKNKNKIWFIGNSKKSDIAPSLEAEIGAIYIPRGKWSHDHYDLDNLDHSRLITLDEIGKIPQIYFTHLSGKD